MCAKQGTIEPDLLSLLVCPKTRATLVEHGGWLYSTDRQTRLKYPIRDGIPILLIEEAHPAGIEEFGNVMEACGGLRTQTQDP
jgi:hypothetical protein